MFDVLALFAAFARSLCTRGAAARRPIDFEAALAAAPHAAARAILFNRRGVDRIAEGEREAAFEQFAMALDDDERCAPALANLGNMLFEDGDVADAIDYYEAAIRADATYAVAYRNLGVALKAAGRRSEAVRALRTAFRLESRRSGRP
ncbi:MAG: hypothetical protein NVS2B3_07310 [Vulcanimicrobiaceae bacterium]